MDKHVHALELARYTVFYGYKHNLFLKKTKKEWGDDPTDFAVRCANMLISMNDQYMVVLSVIVNMLTINCKHPKKYRDKTNGGQWYCMNCNSDLPKIKK